MSRKLNFTRFSFYLILMKFVTTLESRITKFSRRVVVLEMYVEIGIRVTHVTHATSTEAW